MCFHLIICNISETAYSRTRTVPQTFSRDFAINLSGKKTSVSETNQSAGDTFNYYLFIFLLLFFLRRIFAKKKRNTLKNCKIKYVRSFVLSTI